MKIYIVLVAFTLLLCTSCKTCSLTADNYYLYSVHQQSDFNYNMISDIHNLPRGKVKLKNEFRPIKGQFTVLRFLSFYYGMRHGGLSSEMNNLIILKLDSQRRIVDGYFYVLQWGEVPTELFRIRNHNLIARGRVDLKKMKFEEILQEDGDRPLFDHNGFVEFPKDLFFMEIKEDLKEPPNYVYPFEPNEFETHDVSSEIK